MKEFALFNDSFSITKTTTYHLSIRVSRLGYSYCIIDTVRKKCVAVKNINFDKIEDNEQFFKNVQEFLKNDSFLNKFYKSIDFIYQTPKSTLVPAELFDRKVLKTYFQFNQVLDEYEEIHYNKLNKTDAVNIFSIPSEITTLMVNQFPELRFYHQASIFIDNTLKQANNKSDMVSVMTNDDFFDIVVIEAGKLFLHNSFVYQNENDFVYHIMNVYNQLKIKPGKVGLQLSGDIDPEDRRYKLLSKFIGDVRLTGIADNSECQFGFDEVPEHFFSNLLNVM